MAPWQESAPAVSTPRTVLQRSALALYESPSKTSGAWHQNENYGTPVQHRDSRHRSSQNPAQDTTYPTYHVQGRAAERCGKILLDKVAGKPKVGQLDSRDGCTIGPQQNVLWHVSPTREDEMGANVQYSGQKKANSTTLLHEKQ